MDDAYYMNQAIAMARKGVEKGNTPFGACIVRGEEILACSHNQVWADQDITAHAEITALRAACKKADTIDLKGAVLYSTCEPCPMCFSAIHWANIDRIIYGATIEDAQSLGFRELTISNQKMKSEGKSKVEITPRFMQKENQQLFQDWNKNPNKKTY